MNNRKTAVIYTLLYNKKNPNYGHLLFTINLVSDFQIFLRSLKKILDCLQVSQEIAAVSIR